MATDVIEDFLAGLRDELALLHALAEKRDRLLRARVRRLDLIADSNKAIAAQRVVVRQARQVIAQMLDGQGQGQGNQ